MTALEYAPTFKGEAIQLPLDLFIPPDALEIWLESFEGPLDLLLYIIRKNNFDILDIPMAEITRQYTEYVYYIEESRFDRAADYLVMAAWLAEIKSRLLLPKHPTIEDKEESDPRAELIERLQIYAQYKQAAEAFEDMPLMNDEIMPVCPQLPELKQNVIYPELNIYDLTRALKGLLLNRELFETHTITPEHLSLQERMVQILSQLSDSTLTNFGSLIDQNTGRIGIVITFMALLELAKQQLITIEQIDSYAVIQISLSA